MIEDYEKKEKKIIKAVSDFLIHVDREKHENKVRGENGSLLEYSIALELGQATKMRNKLGKIQDIGK